MASFSRFIDAFNFLHHEWKYSREDPWDIRASSYEQGKMMQQFVLVNDRTYSRVLDVGCGAGDFTSLLAKISTEVVALERSSGAVRQARKNLKTSPNVSLVSENIRTYALPASHFDLIVLGEVLYYLSYVSGDRRLGKQSGLNSLLPLIQKLRESLTPGGRILMTNYFSADRGAMTRADGADFRRLFEEAGLYVESEYEGAYKKETKHQQFQITLFQKPSLNSTAPPSPLRSS
jgi:SAM-dependent methyltransferase